MSVTATGKATESVAVPFTNANVTIEDFESKCKHVTLHATDDCHIAFDGETASTASFMLKADSMIDIDNIEFTEISMLGNSTTGTLYILARR